MIEAGYDAMGRLLHRTAAGTAIRFAYDPAGRRVSMEDPVGVTRYQYDAVDRLVTVTRPDGSAFTTTYDAAGQPTARRYPSGRQVSYGYNPDGDLVRLTAPGQRGGSGLEGDPLAGAVLPETISFRRRPAEVRLLGEDDGRGRRPEFLLLGSAAPPALAHTTRPAAAPPLVEATFETDPDGRLLREMLPGGGTRSYQYQAGLLSSFAETRAPRPGDAAITLATAGASSYATSRVAQRATSVADDLVGAACSFSADTGVVMANGTTKAISEVEVGDYVLAEDPETGERGPRKVAHVWEHEDTVVDLEIDGDVVTTTENHPFWNATDREWQEVQELDVGDHVRTLEGELVVIGGFKRRSAVTIQV